MKFGQLIEYKCGGDTIPSLFSRKSKLRISLYQMPKVLSNLFLLYTKLRTIEIHSNLAVNHSLPPYIKLFEKTKRDLELVPHASISA